MLRHICCTGYALAITADNNRTRYIAVFFMGTGAFVFFFFFRYFSRLLTRLKSKFQLSSNTMYSVRFRSMLIYSHLRLTGNCCSSILPNNSSGHYKKATSVGLQIFLADLRCVLLLLYKFLTFDLCFYLPF
jgi:hypothetical protein